MSVKVSRSSDKSGKTIDRDLLALKRFVEVYCCKHHGQAIGRLCDACRELMDYANQRRMQCPHDPKPKCKDCPTHCYQADYRVRIKEVMRYSGIYFVKRGRLDWLIRYFL